MHHGIFTSVVIGAALVEFGLTGINGNSLVGATDGENERQGTTASSVAQVAHDGSTPVLVDPALAASHLSPEEYSRLAMERLIPPSDSNPPPGMVALRGEIAGDIEQGVKHLDSSVRQIPGYALNMVVQVEKHGIGALAYEHPEMKRKGREIGNEVGVGIRSFMTALGKDMVATKQEAVGR